MELEGVQLRLQRTITVSRHGEENGAATSQLRKSLEDKESQTELSQNHISELIRHRDEAEASALAQLEQQKGEMNISENSHVSKSLYQLFSYIL